MADEVWGTTRILVVDDEGAMSEVIRLVLEADELKNVWLAKNCEQAVAQARRVQPNVAVLDYMMPGVNGDEVAARLRVIVPGIKIVSFSAVIDVRPEWADDFVKKVEIADLPTAIRRLAPVA